MIESEIVHINDVSFIDLGQRCHAVEDAPAAIVDDDDAPASVELWHDPRRVAVVDRGEIADKADVLAPALALAEKSGELAVDAVRAAVGLVGKAARLARGDQVPLPDR